MFLILENNPKNGIMGAPSKYTDEIGKSICDMIATTSLGLKRICEKLDVPYRTVRDWIAEENHPISHLYTRAKQLQKEHLADETLDIADDGSNDLMLLTKPNGEQYEVENKEVTNRSKLRVETRKWLLSKLDPKKYGDKVTHAGDADNPLQIITGMRINK